MELFCSCIQSNVPVHQNSKLKIFSWRRNEANGQILVKFFHTPEENFVVVVVVVAVVAVAAAAAAATAANAATAATAATAAFAAAAVVVIAAAAVVVVVAAVVVAAAAAAVVVVVAARRERVQSKITLNCFPWNLDRQRFEPMSLKTKQSS